MENEVAEKYILENQLVSVMNNTKWKEMVKEITSNENFHPPVNIKLIFDTDNNGKFSPVWWNEVERDGFNLIEWLEINPIKEEWVGKLVSPKTTDYTEFIRIGLEKHNIPYEFNNGIFRITGYLRTVQK